MSAVEQPARPSVAEPAARDPLVGPSILARPILPVAVVTLLWAAAATTPALLNLAENGRDAATAIGVWLAATLFGAIPAGALAGVLSARLERRVTGRAAGGRAWLVAGAAAVTFAHWLSHLPWAPFALLDALASDYDFERKLLGAVIAATAWAIASVAFVVGALAWRRLRDPRADARSVTGRSWLDTSVVAAALYGILVLAPGALVALAGIDDGEVLVAVGVWMVGGVVLGAPPAGLAVLVRGRIAGAGASAKLWFWEQLGAVWSAHWLVPLALALLPLWRDRHQADRLALAVGAAGLLVVGVATWGVARAHRQASAG